MVDLLSPLHKLLKKSQRWQWSLYCEKSFKESKKRLISELLVHIDANKVIVITCDA